MAQSQMSHISNYPTDPVEFFKLLLDHANAMLPGQVQLMNLATLDEEFGVLNRTVIYRGLTDNCITYITQRYTRNYQNLLANPKASITFYWPEILVPTEGGEPASWQVRLIGATAVELPEAQLDAFWAEELLPAQIRAHICPCGQPVDFEALQSKHNDFLQAHLSSGKPLSRPATYTAFKFQTQRWDFLKVGEKQIADRVQYRLQDNGQWQAIHVAT